MLLGFIGDQGEGKTLSMTAIGVFLARVGNVPIKGTHSVFIPEYEKVSKFQEIWHFRRGVLLLDEAWVSADSREWGDNVRFSRLVMMARKKNLIILYNAQWFGQVDLRIRNATDWLVQCQNVGSGIWLQLINPKTGDIGRRFLLDQPEQYYKLYDTYEEMYKIADDTDEGCRYCKMIRDKIAHKKHPLAKKESAFSRSAG